MLRSRDKKTGRENYLSPGKSVRISTFTRGSLTDSAIFSQSLLNELRNSLYTCKCGIMQGRMKRGMEMDGWRIAGGEEWR